MFKNPFTRKKEQALSRSPFVSDIAEFAFHPWAISPPALPMIASLIYASAEDIEREVESSHWEREQQLNQMMIAAGVAYIPIRGLIVPSPCRLTDYYRATACSTIIDNLNRALGNPEVEKIVFRCSSPGGVCLGVEEATTLIYRARGQKPMIAVNEGICASAAYSLCSSADQIIAYPSTSSGSIGAYWLHQDISGWLAEIGVKITHLQYGEHKTDGSPFKPLDDKARDSIQAWVDSSGEMFADAVARNRGVDRQHVLDNYGQGEIYKASVALEHGLIDHVAEPDVSILEYFEGTQMSKTNDNSNGDGNQSNNENANSQDQGNQTDPVVSALEKVTSALSAFDSRLDAIESKLDEEDDSSSSNQDSSNQQSSGQDSGNQNTGQDNGQDTNQTSEVDSLRASVEQLTAKLDHMSNSSSGSVSGGDGEGEEKLDFASSFVAAGRKSRERRRK